MNNPSERQQNIDLNINYLDKCQTDYPNNLSGERFFYAYCLYTYCSAVTDMARRNDKNKT